MKFKYRPEIDGLRAIAVLAVVIYHLEINYGNHHFLSGGFLGVDVFFVISGFLITSIILSEHDRTGEFSILHFYERRARRLLPVLLTVIIVSLPFAWQSMYPSQLIGFAKSILSSLAFGSNFYWDINLQKYGVDSALLQPFLHTWSLAVEEQFYVLYPLILLPIYLWFRSYATIILVAGLLISLQFAETMTASDASFSFYMLPSRFWELLAGGLLANVVYLHPQENKKSLLREAMPTLGLLLIIGSVAFVDFESNHPGYITLVPVIGTVLIIWFASENDFVTKILSSKLFVRIGLVSYSLYLWHYPIFAFGRLDDLSPSWRDKTRWVILAFVCAWLTYRFIEKPFRNRQKMSRKYFLVTISTAIIFCVIALVVIIQINAKLVIDVSFEEENQKRRDWKSLGYDVCNQRKSHQCESGPIDKKKILIVGDSMAPDALRIIAKQYPNYRYVMSTAGWCVPTNTELKRRNAKGGLEKCNHLNKTRYQQQSLTGVDGVVIITINYKDNTFSGVSGTPALNSYLSFLKSSGINNIMIFGSYLRVSKRVFDVYLKNGGVIQDVVDKLKIRNENNDSELRELSREYGAEFVSIRDYACTVDAGCKIFIGDVPFSWDQHHWSSEFTEYLSEKMKDRLDASWLD